MPDIAVVGEVMLELAPGQTTDSLTLSYAGDTYNTAVTLARLGVDTAYITRLGRDRYSQAILQRLADENIDTTGIDLSEARVPGLYMIHNSPDGEREFAYWRGQSAARELFHPRLDSSAVRRKLLASPWLYFSGISLAILEDKARADYIDFLQEYRAAGGRIAFDSNYRPRLWASREEAQHFTKLALTYSNVGLLTMDDEEALWGPCTDLAARYHDYALDELVFKRGAEDVLVLENHTPENGNSHAFPVMKVEPVDTTAAGDNFNAGYLAARIQGQSIASAVRLACDCAGIIIQHRGGVIPREVFLEELGERQRL